MPRFLISGTLAASAIAAMLTVGSTGAGLEDREIPSLREFRGEILLPHYARIQGIHDALPGDAHIEDSAMKAAMMVVRMRISELRAGFDDEAVEHFFIQGEAIGISGSYTSDQLQAYAAIVISADTHLTQNWDLATRDFLGYGLEPEQANYLSLHAMAVEVEPFEERYQPQFSTFGPLADPVMTSYQEASEAARIIFGRLEQATSGLDLLQEGVEEAVRMAHTYPDMEI